MNALSSFLEASVKTLAARRRDCTCHELQIWHRLIQRTNDCYGKYGRLAVPQLQSAAACRAKSRTCQSVHTIFRRNRISRDACKGARDDGSQHELCCCKHRGEQSYPWTHLKAGQKYEHADTHICSCVSLVPAAMPMALRYAAPISVSEATLPAAHRRSRLFAEFLDCVRLLASARPWPWPWREVRSGWGPWRITTQAALSLASCSGTAQIPGETWKAVGRGRLGFRVFCPGLLCLKSGLQAALSLSRSAEQLQPRSQLSKQRFPKRHVTFQVYLSIDLSIDVSVVSIGLILHC